LLKAAARAGIRVNVPFHELTEEELRFVFHGNGDYAGVDGLFRFLETKKYKMHVRIFMARYRGYTLCPDCQGARLRREALNVQVAGKTILDIGRMSLAEAKTFFESLALKGQESQIADQLLHDIRHRLTFLNDVGLEYLTLDRVASTLSGGEAQRIQLATSLGSRLVGACYVLDEPSIGLHSRDTGKLIRILEDLRDLGNTILVVEHDADIIRAADHIVDLGPGAGERGGQVIYEGEAKKILSNGGASRTGLYLKGHFSIPVPAQRRKLNRRRQLKFLGARAHNLKNIDVTIPLDVMTVITGVSGSGKSTLVHDVISEGLQAIKRRKRGSAEDQDLLRLACRRIIGDSLIRQVVLVDQSPIGRSPRSNPVTYVKAFDAIRTLFASTSDAKRQGLTPGHFSFNVAGGRCEACQGDGTVTVEMQFLADVSLVCEDCRGQRYKPQVLAIRYQGKNIHEVLQLTIDEALKFFIRTSKVVNKLAQLSEVGLGYLRLGQSATTLSGGEAQRVKLAAHIAEASSEGTLYIFDEPTTGLHFDDIAKLLAAFRRLLDEGGTVLAIEHNLDVIKSADWVIDLGPEGGEGGGHIVAAGRPEQIATCKESHTARYLAKVLGM
jgi:excinuclease ABC subunit A